MLFGEEITAYFLLNRHVLDQVVMADDDVDAVKNDGFAGRDCLF